MLEKYENDIEELCNEIRSNILQLDILYIKSGQMNMKDKDMEKVRELYKKELSIACHLTLMLKHLQDTAQINIAKWKK